MRKCGEDDGQGEEVGRGLTSQEVTTARWRASGLGGSGLPGGLRRTGDVQWIRKATSRTVVQAAGPERLGFARIWPELG